ncbi:MAG: 3-phosphoshikimate 1-carboxyvinyltransferase [Bacteroidaceae bacterium]|nr:3-phosphoshikimate 1-carboxyvinyltransferase [Bacteroidaceae bacterium]
MEISLNIPRKVEATVTLPTSKSISNRALLIQALCPERQCNIAHLAVCDDTEHMQQGIEAKRAGTPFIDIGATGTAMRFLTAYLAITPSETVLTGSERMQQRPIKVLVEALRALGADISYTRHEGYPPLRIVGKNLQGGEVEVEAGISSQYISALLMIGPCLTDGLTLRLKGTIASRTYIELTLDLMRHYGATAEWTDEQTIHIAPGGYTNRPLTVEGDWSGASYWYELAAIASHCGHEMEICLGGLTANSKQGDRIVAEMFEPLGVSTEYTKEGAKITATPQSSLRGGLVGRDAGVILPEGGKRATLDFSHCPDIVQTLAVTCCLLDVPFTFSGIHSLRIKETDRVAALITELYKLGYVLRAEGNELLIWDGERTEPEPHPTIVTYDDHRMAMAFAPAALCHEGLTIENPEVVTKSYPGYWEDLLKLKKIKVENS